MTRPPGSTDSTTPTVSASPRGGTFTSAQTVTLTTNEPEAQIYYTTDGKSPLDVAAGATTPNSISYEGPFSVEPPATGSTVVLKFAAIDAAGNTSAVVTETYTFGTAAAPGAPTVGTVTAGSGTATVNWTAPTNPGSSAITGYVVTATPRHGRPGHQERAAQRHGVDAHRVDQRDHVRRDRGRGERRREGAGIGAAVSVTPVAPAADTLTITRAQ